MWRLRHWAGLVIRTTKRLEFRFRKILLYLKQFFTDSRPKNNLINYNYKTLLNPMKDKISVIRFLYNLWYKNLFELENWKIRTPTAKSKLNCFLEPMTKNQMKSSSARIRRDLDATFTEQIIFNVLPLVFFLLGNI